MCGRTRPGRARPSGTSPGRRWRLRPYGTWTGAHVRAGSRTHAEQPVHTERLRSCPRFARCQPSRTDADARAVRAGVSVGRPYGARGDPVRTARKSAASGLVLDECACSDSTRTRPGRSLFERARVRYASARDRPDATRASRDPVIASVGVAQVVLLRFFSIPPSSCLCLCHLSNS